MDSVDWKKYVEEFIKTKEVSHDFKKLKMFIDDIVKVYEKYNLCIDTAYIDAGARSNLIVTEINDNLKEHYFNPISMLYEDSFGDYGYGEGNCDGNNSFLKKEERFDEDQIEKELEGNK